MHLIALHPKYTGLGWGREMHALLTFTTSLDLGLTHPLYCLFVPVRLGVQTPAFLVGLVRQKACAILS